MVTSKKTTIYIVQPGDTLWAIANKFNTTIPTLLALNPFINSQFIYPGQNLHIPSSTFKEECKICWYNGKQYSPGAIITITANGEKLKCHSDGTWHQKDF